MGRPAEGLRRQGSARRGHSVFNTPTAHTIFVPFSHLTPSLLYTPCGRGTRDGGRTRFGNRAAARLSRRASRPRSRDMLNMVRPSSRCAQCGRDEVREGHLLLKNLRSAARPLRPRPALPRQGSASGREIAVRGQSGRSIGPCFLYVAVYAHIRLPNTRTGSRLY